MRSAKAVPVGPKGVLWMAAAAAVSPGDVLQHPSGLAGVYCGMENAAAGNKIALNIENDLPFEIVADTTVAFAAGAKVDWDAAAGQLVATTTGDFEVGTVVATKAIGVATASVLLNR